MSSIAISTLRALVFAGVVMGCGAGRAPAPPVVVVLGSGPSIPVGEAPTPATPLPDPECPPSCVPDTEVPDTAENRSVIAFCERYRRAVVAKDVPLLLSLVSPRYHDAGGMPDGGDVVDRAGFQEYLKQHFSNVEQIEYAIHYRQIVHKGATIHVECTIDGMYMLAGATRRHHDENTIVLERTRGGFLILSGM